MHKRLIKLYFVVAGLITVSPACAQVVYKVAAGTVHISGTSTLSDWTVRSEKISGDIVLNAEEKKSRRGEMPPRAMREGKAMLEVTSIKSEKGETMDNKMYKALKSDEHPTITFVLTEPVQIVKVPLKAQATGNVTIAGVTKPMTFDLDVSGENNSFRFHGSRSLKLSDFGIEPPTAMFGQIETGDEIVVTLDVTFTQ